MQGTRKYTKNYKGSTVTCDLYPYPKTSSKSSFTMQLPITEQVLIYQVLSSLLHKNFFQVLPNDFVQEPLQLTSVLLIQKNTQTLTHKCICVYTSEIQTFYLEQMRIEQLTKCQHFRTKGISQKYQELSTLDD